MAYRVIQWYTGFVAQEQIRLIHTHPELELVGAVVFHQEKEGVDAGEIAGIDPIGIRATADMEKALSIEADCVLYNAPWERYDEIIRILESGKNVVTLNGGYYPKADPDIMNRLEEACKAGNSTLIGSGVSPGWAGDLVALIASSQCSEIRRIHHLEVGDLRGYDPITLGVMGFGKALKELEESDLYQNYMSSGYKQMIHLVADALSFKVEDFTIEKEFALAKREVENGVVKEGTVAGIRINAAGIVNGMPTITHEMVWIVDYDLGPDWPTEKIRGSNAEHHAAYTLTIEGRPNIKVRTSYYGYGTSLQSGLLAAAARMVNDIHVACEAEPGVQTFLSVPVPHAWKPFQKAL